MIPTAKVAAGGAAGALAILITYILGEFHVELPDVVVAALTTLITFGAAYFKKDSPGKHAE